MPELPEVETIARGVDRLLRGDRIESAWFSQKREPFLSSPRTMSRALRGRSIRKVFRVGKHIVFKLTLAPSGRGDGSRRDAPSIEWIVHLGMTGRLLVAGPRAPVAPHTHAILRLASARELHFVDPRRFGRIVLRTEGDRNPFRGTGAEPLSIAREAFAALFQRRTPIKSALLNQKLLQGVGNIYADESLFRARIAPWRTSAGLTRRELDRLHASVGDILREAIALGGSSIANYVNAAGSPGRYQLEHKVYGQAGQPCPVCGQPVRRMVIAGRSSHYCPNCQKGD